MIRIYEPALLTIGHSHSLGERGHHHLLHVLRAKMHDSLVLFNGDGCDYHAEIRAITKKHVEVQVLDKKETDFESPLSIHLAQCLPSGDKMDYIVQKAVELGVKAITPIIAERSQGRLHGEQAQKKIARLNLIAVSACEQCGRNRIPTIALPLALADWLDQSKTDQHRYVLAPKQREMLSITKSVKSLSLLVGPEGGFTEQELALTKQHGLKVLSLGKRILRTETASLAAISILQWCAGDLSA